MSALSDCYYSTSILVLIVRYEGPQVVIKVDAASPVMCNYQLPFTYPTGPVLSIISKAPARHPYYKDAVRSVK